MTSLAGAVLALAATAAGGAVHVARRAVRTRDPLCAAEYAGGPLRGAKTLRFGIDPEPAGSAGNGQNRVRPVNRGKALAALRSLRPRHRELVLRVNRLFEADGNAGIKRFERIIRSYTREGFDTELQVRYHPSPGEAGNLADWKRYVRRVVDVFGSNRRLVAMTITNEVNVRISPNTSDGAYPRAEDALVQGVIAAHREAQRRRYRQLRFGFTFAYGFDPATNAAVFNGLERGGSAFRRALGFVGVDYYPELFPGRATALPAATLRMLGTMRRCLMPLGGLGAKVPIWITESGYDSTPGVVSPEGQRTALRQIVNTVRRAARTFGVTDFRWFNLRDNFSNTTAFAETSGLLTDSYRRKPAFAAYRGLIARYGTAPTKPARP